MTFYRRLRSALSPVRASLRRAGWKCQEWVNSIGPEGRPGSRRWLIQQEIRFGGIVDSVERRRVSDLDQRSLDELRFGGMTGGDRMLHHGYARHYEHCLGEFLGTPGLVICEIGILRGSGLALWSELFPSCSILGLDVDLSHFHDNLPNLQLRGAFSAGPPETFFFDQLLSDSSVISEALQGRTLDIVIDDGLHSPEAVQNTLAAIRPHLSKQHCVIIEDMPPLESAIFHPFVVTYSGELFTALQLASGA